MIKHAKEKKKRSMPDVEGNMCKNAKHTAAASARATDRSSSVRPRYLLSLTVAVPALSPSTAMCSKMAGSVCGGKFVCRNK